MKTNHIVGRILNPSCLSVALLRAAVVIALVLPATVSWAANGYPPEYMTYQGFVADGNGEPLGNTNTGPKNYDVVFRIWTDGTAGTRLWTEQQTVTVDKGYFSVLLGEGAPYQSESRPPALSTLFTNIANASDRYIELMVRGIGAGNTDVTILPRLRLLTSPYAFLARNAVAAQNIANSVNSNILTVSGTNIGISKANPSSALDVNGTVTATTFSGSGSSLTSLNANNLSSGTVPDARLSANVAKLNASPQTFTGYNVFGDNMQLGTSSADYQHLRIGGGNSSGFLYGSYPGLGDGIHLGYNCYYDAAGAPQYIQAAGGTTRLSVGYGGITLATGPASTAPAARLFVNADGNVGIGTTTPGFPLNFPNTLGDKISLFGNGGNHYGLGIANNALQIHTSTSAADVVFGYGQSTNLTETFRVKGNGDVTVSGALYGSAPYLKYVELTTNTPAGAAVSGTNNWRKFNLEMTDTHSLGATNGAGDIILPAGTYQCRISAPGFRVTTHQIRLRTSTGSNILFGTIGYADEATGGSQDRSHIDGQFFLGASTTLRVQHYCRLSHAQGLGQLLGLINWGDTNQTFFAVAEFWKIK